jgi:hypothetical protein
MISLSSASGCDVRCPELYQDHVLVNIEMIDERDLDSTVQFDGVRDGTTTGFNRDGRQRL